jgi:hypothetical protein
MKKVIILGKGPGWSECPEPTAEVPVWSMTNILVKRTAVTKVFEIHNLRKKFDRPRGEGLMHQEACREAQRLGIPYVVREHWDFLPNLIQHVYPWKDVFAEFNIDFIGCSMDAMIALAIHQGYESIHLHGTGQHRGSVYDYQVESINFWLGVCVGRKLEFYIHHWGGVRHSDILTTRDGLVYGLGGPMKLFSYTNTVDGCTCNDMPHGAVCETHVKYV